MPDPNLNDLLGKPWVRGAEGPIAYDCYGLCREVCKRAEIQLPWYPAVVAVAERSEKIKAEQKTVLTKLDQPEPWCLVMFELVTGFVSHIGVVLPDCKRFIHIMEKSSVTRERLDRTVWRNKLDGFYKYIR